MDHALNLPAAQALVAAPARATHGATVRQIVPDLGAAPARATPALPLPPAPAPAPALAAAQTLALPSVDEPWRYAWACAKAALGSSTGPHRLHAQRAGHYSAPVQVSAGLARRWRAVFDVPARAAACVPLPAHQSVGLLLQARLFADLGLKRRHLRHLQHRSVHHAGVATCAGAREQQLSCHVQRVLRLGEDGVLVELQTQVRSAAGLPLALLHDGFLVQGLPAADLAGLGTDSAVLRQMLGLRRRLPRLSATVGTALVSAMPVPAGMGWAYGRIAGDLSPVHTSRAGAFLFGLARPCLQAMALRHLVVRHLAELGLPLGSLDLTFVRAAQLGQDLLLIVDGGALEVHDAQGRLVACGALVAPEAAAASGAAALRTDSCPAAPGAVDLVPEVSPS